MKIIGLSTIQIVEEIADIVLSVEFALEEIKEQKLTATTVWVTYDLQGNFQQAEIADQGLSVNLVLTDEESMQVEDYIKIHGLKTELMKQIFHRDLLRTGEMNEHPLLEGYKRIGWVTEVYPTLQPFGIELADNLYDYHIFENEQGERLMLEHTSNNWSRFICEGTEPVVTAHFKNLFPEVDLEAAACYYPSPVELSQKKEMSSVIYKAERDVVRSSVSERLLRLEHKIRELKELEKSILTEREQKNCSIMLRNAENEKEILVGVKTRLDQEMYNSAMGHNLKPTIEDITEGLTEIIECTDGFYTDGNRLDPKLSNFAGYINVIRKVASDLIKAL